MIVWMCPTLGFTAERITETHAKVDYRLEFATAPGRKSNAEYGGLEAL
jgi:hypothetical protein